MIEVYNLDAVQECDDLFLKLRVVLATLSAFSYFRNTTPGDSVNCERPLLGTKFINLLELIPSFIGNPNMRAPRE